MPFDTVLKSWQVVGIDAILAFERDQEIQAAILGDSAGLGKTLQVIGWLVAVSIPI
jgi:SNF2 family DNA or RNA helicase